MNILLGLIVVTLFPSDRAAADRLFEAGEWAKAREAYAVMLDQVEEPAVRAVLLDRIGTTHFMEGALWAAEASFGESLDAQATPEAYYHRGRTYFYIGQRSSQEPGAVGAEVRALMNDAISDLRRGIELDPGNADAWVFIGYCERYRYETDAEAAAYRKALEIEPGRPDASLNLAWILEGKGELEAARELLLAVAADGRTTEHWMAIGRLSGLLGDVAESRAAYVKVALLAPGYDRSYYALWAATREEKRFRQFEKEMKSVLEAHPDAWLADYYLGFCYMETKEPEKAIASFEKVRAQRPDWQDPLYRIAIVRHYQLDDRDGALEGYLEILERDPGHAEARRAIDYIAGVEFTAGRFAEARRLFAALRKADPSEPRHLLNLALLERELGDTDEALSLYRRGEEQFPFEPQFSNDRGLLLMALGREEDAFAAFKKALDRDPEDLNALENLGAYSRLRGDYDAAIRYFLTASRAVRAGGDEAAKFRRYLDMVAREREEAR